MKTKQRKSKQQIQFKTTEKINAEVVSEILRIEKEEGLTADAVVENAQDKLNPLHELFEWDNEEASYRWRVFQARQLINEIKIIVEDKEVYAFENVSVEVNVEDKTTKRQYKPIYDIMNSKDLREQILKTALVNLNYWQEKYSGYNEFNPVFDSIEKVKKQLENGK